MILLSVQYMNFSTITITTILVWFVVFRVLSAFSLLYSMICHMIEDCLLLLLLLTAGVARKGLHQLCSQIFGFWYAGWLWRNYKRLLIRSGSQRSVTAYFGQIQYST